MPHSDFTFLTNMIVATIAVVRILLSHIPLHNLIILPGEGHVSRECQDAPKPKTCYKCGGEGHLARDCDQAGGQQSGGGGNWGGNNNTGGGYSGGGGGGGGGQECYKCQFIKVQRRKITNKHIGGQVGHIARSCPQAGGDSYGGRGGGYGGGRGGYSGGGQGGGQTCYVSLRISLLSRSQLTYHSPAVVMVITARTALRVVDRSATIAVRSATSLESAHLPKLRSVSATAASSQVMCRLSARTR